MTGRRPNLSDKTPSTGEKKNCIRANTVPKMPFQVAAEFMLPPRKSRINFGNTCASNPSTNMSTMTVTKMNGIAAWRFFIAREVSTQRCSGVCVNRRWIGFSQDDVNNRRRRRYQAGKPSGSCRTNALRTTRSTLAILRDDAAFLSLAENRGAREYKRWIGFSQDDVGNRRRRKYQAGKP